MWVILPNDADWDCFKTLTSREILKIRNPLLEEHCAFLEVIQFVPISWMCKKQTAVSYSSTESEIMSLDIGLKLDGLPALELCDLIVSVLGNVSRVSDGSGKHDNDVHKHHKLHNKNDKMKDIVVPSNDQSARQEALLYVFEDNEAVIKMIKKRESYNETCFQNPQSCSRLVVRSNQSGFQNPNQIHRHQKPTRRHLDKGNFTRDEWNHLLSLFNTSHFSSTVCSAAMAKRIQQESGEDRVTAKSRPMMNLTARMPSVVSSSTSSSPGRTSYGYQDPGKSVAVDDRSGQLDRLSPARYSKLDYGHYWSSHESKSEVTAHDRSGKLDKTSWNAVQQIRPPS